MSPSTGTPIVSLLFTVFTCILEVFLLCLSGYLLAKRGILDKKTQKKLNQLNVSLFTPSLLFSKVAFFLSPAKLRELWIIPLFFVLVTVVSMSVAFILGSIFRLKKSQRSFALAASMFMNSNSLPIALMQSLVVTVKGLKWGDDDNKNAMLGRALSYLVLYSTLGMILRWSYGVRLLTQADDEIEEVTNAAVDENSPLLSSIHPYDPPHVSHSIPPEIIIHKSARPTPLRAGSKFYNSFPNSPNMSRINLSENEPTSSVSTIVASSPHGSDSDSDLEDMENNDSSLPTTSSFPPQPSATHVFLRNSRQRISKSWSAFCEFMTVPLWAALASIVVACIGPIQHALDVHLQPIKGALASAGSCSIPITLVVLGAYFYQPPAEEDSKQNRPRSKKSQSLLRNVREMFSDRKNSSRKNQVEPVRPGETKTVAIAVISRMILTPMILLPLMGLASRFALHEIFDDPVFVVTNVLLISSPPALTLAQITQQAASGDAFERLISRTIFWAYCIVTPPATVFYVVIGLVLSRL
ncbi:auxin efflux carrier [Mycena floridula]|nr:auxin efflux carrier [Mycena floridula]